MAPSVLADINSFAAQLESGTKAFFGDSQPAFSDPLEVLKIKVGSVIIADYKPLQKIAASKDPMAESKGNQVGDLESLKIDQIIEEVETRHQVSQETNFDVGVSIPKHLAKANDMDQASSGRNGQNWAVQLYEETEQQKRVGAIMIDKIKKVAKPTWHAPWKLKRVSLV